jgi:excisionase family DNA binding protein
MTSPSPKTLERALYSVKEFCRRNSIGKTTFYELVKTGAVETVKVGSHTLVPATSETAWHATLSRTPTNKPTYNTASDLSERPRPSANHRNK